MSAITVNSGSTLTLANCIFKKLEQAVTATGNIVLGETLFAKRQLELAPFRAIKFSGWDDWEQDPLNNRSWQWRLNWLSFLPYLMAYHSSAGDDEVLDFAREAIQSWCNAYLETDTSYPFEFIWHDHATALRAEQLVLFAYWCRERAPTWADQQTEFLSCLERALVVHGQWLAKDSFYSEHTNHGLEQARVLLLLGTVFDGEQAHEWQQIAIRRISSELAFAFTEEGVHVENSPAYHIFVFKVFMGIIKDYPKDVLGGLAEKFRQFSSRALNFITHILRPDGKLPPIGDTEQLPTSNAYRDMFGQTIEYQYFLYAVTQGREGEKPPVLNRIYPKSGYAILRDQWMDKAYYQKTFHLIAKVGCSSRYHHQQDEGHISLYAGGEDWLIDSGLYNYVNNDPVRKYMRGRQAHNVPLISHAKYSKDFEHRLSSWKVIDWNEDSLNPYVKMCLRVLQPVVHERSVMFDAQNKIVRVVDEFNAVDDIERDYTLQWHLPKDKDIQINDQMVLVISTTGSRMQIELSGAKADTIYLSKGQSAEKVYSCISYKANQVEPSQVVRVLFKARKELRVETSFRFELTDFL